MRCGPPKPFGVNGGGCVRVLGMQRASPRDLTRCGPALAAQRTWCSGRCLARTPRLRGSLWT